MHQARQLQTGCDSFQVLGKVYRTCYFWGCLITLLEILKHRLHHNRTTCLNKVSSTSYTALCLPPTLAALHYFLTDVITRIMGFLSGSASLHASLGEVFLLLAWRLSVQFGRYRDRMWNVFCSIHVSLHVF